VPITLFTKKPKRPFPILTVAGFIYGALVFVGMDLEEHYWAHRFATAPVIHTKATITSLAKISGKSGPTYYIDYQFLDASDIFHHRRADVPYDAWILESVNGIIPVEYLADNPSRSQLSIESPTSRESIYLLMGGLMLAVALGTGFGRWNDGTTKRIPLTWHGPSPTTHDGARLFRAYFKEHWIFSSMLFWLGALLAWLALFPHKSGGTDDSLAFRIAVLPIGLGLLSLPFIFHYRFYVRTDHEYLETRGFGTPRRIAWRELKCVWTHRTSQVEFASMDDGLIINFKLFSRDCQRAVRERVHELFGKSI
jgi:hypothetical protein